MGQNYKLVSKMEGNIAAIYFAIPSGECREICRICFPNDSQVNDNCDAINEISAVLKRRIKKSL